MTKSILVVSVLLAVTLMLTACQQKLGGVHNSSISPDMYYNLQLITSTNAALTRATQHIKDVNLDVSKLDMSQPDGIHQSVSPDGRKVWLVSWKPKDPASKGNKLFLIIYEQGQVEEAWGQEESQQPPAK